MKVPESKRVILEVQGLEDVVKKKSKPVVDKKKIAKEIVQLIKSKAVLMGYHIRDGSDYWLVDVDVLIKAIESKYDL